MLSEEKIKQVFNAIKENGISAFTDDALVKLLSILTPDELDDFESKSIMEFDSIEDTIRVMELRPMVSNYIASEMRRIQGLDYYRNFIESLKTGEYNEYIKTLMVEEIADLKRYISYSIRGKAKVKQTGTDKLIRILTKAIKEKESQKKPHFI